jgi:hypothetical protein
MNSNYTKNELLTWINTTFQLNLSKIEHCASGAVYCQIIDSLFPDKIKMTKVNWKARQEVEFLENYKYLQQAFQLCKIDKNFDPVKLSKGKQSDNLEFLQWMKMYFDEKVKNGFKFSYDAEKRRNGQKLDIISENINTKSRGNSKEQIIHSKIVSNGGNTKIRPIKEKVAKIEKISNIVQLKENVNPDNSNNIIQGIILFIF